MILLKIVHGFAKQAFLIKGHMQEEFLELKLRRSTFVSKGPLYVHLKETRSAYLVKNIH